MVELNHKDRTINVKIVYYGPAVGGKTTNIQMLHQHASATRRGELISVNSAQDRTIMFDLLPIKTIGFRGFDLKVQLLAVPGQAMYAATRRLVVRNVDSLVFVANSAADRQEENMASFREMTTNLVAQHIDPAVLPLVFQYNKRDLPDVTPIQTLDRTLNARQTNAIPAVALRGEGVLETFAAILNLTVSDLARRYRLMDMGKGQSVEDWTVSALQEIFKTTSLAPKAAAKSDPNVMEIENAGRRTVRVVLPHDVSGALTPDARANEALVDSYAEASLALGAQIEQIREERDRAQRRLADVLQVLQAARSIQPGRSFDSVLGVTLECLAQELDVPHASFLVPDKAQGARIVALRGIDRDPLLSHPPARAFVGDLLASGAPALHEAEHSGEILGAFQAFEPQFGSAVSVPLFSQRGPVGVALLYLSPYAAPPSAESRAHMAFLARAIGPFLEPRSGGGDAALEILGTAARLTAGPLLESLLDLRQRQAELRLKLDSPPWLSEALTRMAAPLTEAVGIGRALQALDRGSLEREAVMVSDLLAQLRSLNLVVDVAPGVTSVPAHATLLRVAIQALAERAREQADAERRIEVRCSVLAGRLVMRVGSIGTVTPVAGADPRRVLATRIVEAHGGRVSIEEDPARGGWAIFELPLT